MEIKNIFLFDTDEIVIDIKNACTENIITLGLNKVNHVEGVAIIPEGSLMPYFQPKEIENVCKKITTEIIENCLSNFNEDFDLNNIDFYHTFSMRDNFRKKIDLDYKKRTKDYYSFANSECRQWIIDEYKIFDKNNSPDGKVFVGSDLEADDRIGIAATYFYRKYSRLGYDVRVFVYSQDKDIKTIPNVYIYNPNSQELIYNNYYDSVKFFFKQLLAGDKADNIMKTPKQYDFKNQKILKSGYGMTTAESLVEESLKNGFKYTYNKIKYIYQQSNIENQCLINAQLLRILTIDFFDTKEQKPILFNEDMLDFLDQEFAREMNIL